MAKLADTQVYGSLTVDNALVAAAGSGYSNMVVYISGVTQTYTFPAALQVPGAKFKVTLIGGGGGSAGSAATNGILGGGGASGAVCVAVITVVSGLYSFTYSIGAAGTAGSSTVAGGTGGSTTVLYNSVTYTAAGGAGGSLQATFNFSTGGTATNGTLNLQGGYGGGGGTFAANAFFSHFSYGGNTPLGFGQGGDIGYPGSLGGGSGYGSGSGGSLTTASAIVLGTVGTSGLLIIEY
jgi:hypothetical protein